MYSEKKSCCCVANEKQKILNSTHLQKQRQRERSVLHKFVYYFLLHVVKHTRNRIKKLLLMKAIYQGCPELLNIAASIRGRDILHLIRF
jgi:hypothetical protein